MHSRNASTTLISRAARTDAVAGVTRASDEGDPYGVTYYPGNLVGDPITIAAGERRLDLNFRLSSSPGFRVTGRVENGYGEPVARASVSVVHLDIGPGIESLINGQLPKVITGPDGVFSFRNVGPGPYALQAILTNDERARLTTTVTSADLSGLVLLQLVNRRRTASVRVLRRRT